MKKYILFLIISILILVAVFTPNVQAGKPKSTEYPPPDTFEIQSYPPPNPTPVPMQPAPGLPTEFCAVYGVPCAWGWFTIAPYQPGWWMSIDGLGPQPDIPDAVICITSVVGYDDYCDQLYFVTYDAVRDRNWYKSSVRPHCGHWYIFMAYMNNTPAEIKQPNDWLVKCVFLPGLKKG